MDVNTNVVLIVLMLLDVLCFIRVCNMYCIILQGCSWRLEINWLPPSCVCCRFNECHNHYATNPQHWRPMRDNTKARNRQSSEKQWFLAQRTSYLRNLSMSWWPEGHEFTCDDTSYLPGPRLILLATGCASVAVGYPSRPSPRLRPQE